MGQIGHRIYIADWNGHKVYDCPNTKPTITFRYTNESKCVFCGKRITGGKSV